jgi:hypothetical protein
MKIEAGKYYERADGEIHIAKRSHECRGCDIKIGDAYYDSSKEGKHKLANREIVRELQLAAPTLGFPLVAGERYETQLPSGEAGPVVELETSAWRKMFKICYPWCVEADAAKSVNTRGEVFKTDYEEPVYRIVRPYIAPPPTPIERLEKWRDAAPRGFLPELNAIIADLKASVKP